MHQTQPARNQWSLSSTLLPPLVLRLFPWNFSGVNNLFVCQDDLDTSTPTREAEAVYQEPPSSTLTAQGYNFFSIEHSTNSSYTVMARSQSPASSSIPTPPPPREIYEDEIVVIATHMYFLERHSRFSESVYQHSPADLSREELSRTDKLIKYIKTETIYLRDRTIHNIGLPNYQPDEARLVATRAFQDFELYALDQFGWQAKDCVYWVRFSMLCG